MKISIELPEKFIEVAKGLLLAECKKEEDELHIEEVANILKSAKGQIYISQDTIANVCGEEIGHINMLLALFALTQGLKEKGY